MEYVLVMMDLNGLKAVNDNIGHEAGEASSPENVIIYGGKTGTTEDAGACLALLSKDLYGNPYLSVILHSQTKEELYTEMNQILSLIEN